MPHSYILDFIQSLKRQNRSKHTLQNYQRDLQQFSDFFLSHYPTHSSAWYRSQRVSGWISNSLHQQLLQQSLEEAPWQKVSSQAVKDFLSYRVSHEVSATTLARQLSTFRGFYHYFIEKGDFSHDPIEGVKAPKPVRPLPKSISVDMAYQLLEPLPAEQGERWQAERDQAMFELLYSSGLRVSELQQLNWRDDVLLEEGWLRIEFGKGNKSRMVPVGTLAQKALERWLAIRNQYAQLDEEAMFVNPQGKRLSIRGIQKALDRRALKTGIPLKMSPHRLRHACATHLLESSGDLRAVQELLGHENLSTTQIYTKLDLQHLAEVYDRTHPRAKRKT